MQRNVIAFMEFVRMRLLVIVSHAFQRSTKTRKEFGAILSKLHNEVSVLGLFRKQNGVFAQAYLDTLCVFTYI